VSGTLGNAPWYVGDVSVTWTVTDVQSSISSTTGCGPTTISADTTGATLSCSATSAGGMSSQSVTVKRDATSPSITYTVPSPDGSNGWYLTAPTIVFECSDATSGVAACEAVGGSGAAKTLGESAGAQFVSGNAADNAGNTESATAGPFMVDLSDPVISPNVEPGSPTGENGWYTGDVELSWSMSDPQSGIGAASGCEVVNVTSDQVETIYTCSATNDAGRSDSVSVQIKRDATPPQISSLRSPAPNGYGWNDSDVTVSFSCSDASSGLAGACPADVAVGEGSNQSVTGSVSDNAGNSASVTESDINVDNTAPSIQASPSPAPNEHGWNKTDVTVSYTCSDALSGLDPLYGNDGAGCRLDDTASDEGVTMFVGSVRDLAGNSASVTSTAMIDKTAPAISSARSPGPNVNGWNDEDVTVSFDCSDSLSGLEGACPSPVTVSSEGAGQSVTRSVSDKAGNSGAATESGISIDKTDPNVVVAGVQDGAEYVLGSAPVPSCTASDDLSGLAAAAHLALEGGSPNGVGTFVATCSATDLAGNSANATKTYHVVYGGLSGILQPINADASSLFNRGRAVPVKFRLDGDPLPSGFATADWQLQRVSVSCETGTEYTSEDVASVTPSTSFRYDASADQYIYNADFRDKPAGTCWKVRVTLDSGQVLSSARFKLQR
jgi:hypothetical protein